MCEFLSAVVLRPFENSPLRIICDPAGTDSHSDLCAKFGVKDSGNGESAKVEFTPPKKAITVEGKTVVVPNYLDFDNYAFTIDEQRAPSWWTDDIQHEVVFDLRARLERMVVRENTPYLSSGSWIVMEGVRVNRIEGRCLTNYGNIDSNYGSIDSNYGSIGSNRGSIDSNRGSIDSNYGSIDSNRGSIDSNRGSIAAGRDANPC